MPRQSSTVRKAALAHSAPVCVISSVPLAYSSHVTCGLDVSLAVSGSASPQDLLDERRYAAMGLRSVRTVRRGAESPANVRVVREQVSEACPEVARTWR